MESENFQSHSSHENETAAEGPHFSPQEILSEFSIDMANCIQACVQCHLMCERTIQHCLLMGGVHADPAHIRLLHDCAQICSAAADFMMRNSELHFSTCRICSEICLACANDCESIAGDDSVMKLCAEACRACAATCGEMAAHRH